MKTVPSPRKSLLAICSFAALLSAFATPVAFAQIKWNPGHYMLLYRGDLNDPDPQVANDAMTDAAIEIENEPNIEGIKARWYWRYVEPNDLGVYDWSRIDHALTECGSRGKRLVIGIETEKFGGGFSETEARKLLPDYIIDDSVYYGGGTESYYQLQTVSLAAKTYVPEITTRYIAMMKAMAAHLSTHTYFSYLEAVYAGQEETAPGTTLPSGVQNLYTSERARMGAEIVTAFPTTTVIQGFNFIPGNGTEADEAVRYPKFMQHIELNRLAIGGPDIFGVVPAEEDYTPAQETLFGLIGGTDYRGRVPVMFDIQRATLERGTPSLDLVFEVAYNRLRSSHIFWGRRDDTGDGAQWPEILAFIQSLPAGSLSNGLIHEGKSTNYGGELPRVVELETFVDSVSEVAAKTDPFIFRTNPDDVLFQATGVNDYITFKVPDLAAGTYNIDVTVQKGPNRATFRLESNTALTGTYTQHGSVNTWQSSGFTTQTMSVATSQTFSTTGTRYFRFWITGTSGSAYYIAIDKLTFTPTNPGEINVKYGATNIADGDTTPSVTEGTNFGSADIGMGTVEKTYTISNSGNGPLILGGVVAAQPDFSVSLAPSTIVASGGNTTFTVAFMPQTAGIRTATLRFYNTDTSEGNYDFALQGVGSDALAWLKLDETSGTTAFDSSSNGNNGTLTGGPTWVTGKSGNGLSFDGVDDRVNLNSPTSLDNLGAFTAMAWMKATNLGEGGKGRIVDKSSSTGPGNGWAFFVDGTNQLELIVDHATTDVRRLSANNVFATGFWYHVAVTWNGSATATNIKFYVNGVETGYGTTTNGAGARTSDSSSNASVGNDSTGARSFNGVLDDVRVYNRVLTSSEIAAIHQGF